ncbi:hypothetical protein PR202_gb15407 [Eleusine coracana subsp. coracana]|uniref:Uncharacterized protein n=1 Tax=Eleusine coracana subsp. coracana TaxID=191504 RepID=A0AAV5EXX7_ELECO|nr:hypothetical protein PR202_gb15407 [Eleusine coracana subsp. coracana]
MFIIAQVADIIKEELWPNPLKFFNNGSEDEFEEDEDEEEDEAILFFLSVIMISIPFNHLLYTTEYLIMPGSDEEEDQDGSGEEGGDN